MGKRILLGEEMLSEFHIAGNLFAEVRFRTAASFQCTIQARDENLPNISSEAGTIDIHYPCDEGSGIAATILLDTETLEVEDEAVPSLDQFKSAIFAAFQVAEDADYNLIMSSGGQLEEDSFDRNAYY